MRVVRDVGRRPDDDWHAKGERGRRDPERAQPRLFFRAPDGGNDPGRARRARRIHLDQPFRELSLEILRIEEAPLLEET